jgi:CRP-like cAMP-binding protein
MTQETKLVRFNTGDVLCGQGETGREMYILRSGRVQIYMKKGKKQIPLTVLGKGSYVGEMSFLAGIPRTATVTAKEPVVASVITPDVLRDDSLGIHEWAFNIARVLVERIQKTTSLLGDYLVESAGCDKTPPKKAEVCGEETQYFRLTSRDRPPRIYLKGYFYGDNINTVKDEIRRLKTINSESIVLDFSEVIDIDQEGLNYLHEITRRHRESSNGMVIENVQLIRNKVISIKGIEEIIRSHKLPQKRIEAGEYLIRSGEEENTMYVVKQGSFAVTRTVDGKKVELAKAEARDVIGEMTLLKGGKRSADVRALKSSTVYIVEIDDFYKNNYNVPKWFMDLIRGLIDKLRQTNSMIEATVKNRRKKENKNRWPAPIGMILDSSMPGRIIVQGNLTMDNLEYLSVLVNSLILRGIFEVYIDLNKTSTIEKESIMYLLHLNLTLKQKGGKLILLGPHKDIFKLFKQYDVIMR